MWMGAQDTLIERWIGMRGSCLIVPAAAGGCPGVGACSGCGGASDDFDWIRWVDPGRGAIRDI